jgi:PEGA domain
MGVFDETSEPKGSGMKLLVVLALLLAVGAGILYVSRREPAPAPEVSRPARTRPLPASKPAPADRAPRDSPPATDMARPTPRAGRELAPPAPAPRPAGALRVRSDVPGASVFLDRKFLGTTPLDVDGLAAGSHRLNVSVEGYEGHAQAIEIGDVPADVDVRFKEVRLNAAVPVVHKHGVGSCSGQLVADPAGLRYETANREDAFTLRFEDVDIFVVDYLKKNLRVKKRGGRTWNFEDPKGQADPLFVFHRDVEKARARLAAR